MTSVVKVHGFSKEDSGHFIVENCTRVIDYSPLIQFHVHYPDW
jgi:hypothetical protein